MDSDLYIDHVQLIAKKLGKIYIIDSGEGRDYYDEDTKWYIEDLSGWLINDDDKTMQIFNEIREQNYYDLYEKFSDSYRFAEWTITDIGEILIDFKDYRTYLD